MREVGDDRRKGMRVWGLEFGETTAPNSQLPTLNPKRPTLRPPPAARHPPRPAMPSHLLRRSRRTAKRGGITNTEGILMVVLVAVVLMVVIGLRPHHERSPFALAGIAPGMSIGDVRSAMSRRGGKVDCQPAGDSYQLCTAKYGSDAGMVAVVIDPTKHVIVVQGMMLAELEGLKVQAESAQVAWTRVAEGVAVPPLIDHGDTGAVRWTSRDQHWTAETHFNGTRDPDVPTRVILIDTKGVQRYAESSEDNAENAKLNGWTPPTAEEAIAARERRRVERKSDYGAMMTTLSELGDFETGHYNAHHSYTDNVAELPGLFIIGATHLEILSASDSGWIAKATLPGFPNSSCVAVGGRVAPAEFPTTAGGRTASGTGVTCDPMPAATTASQGSS